MPWLYRLQQRLAITAQESTAVLVLALLLLAGISARYAQPYLTPLPEPPPSIHAVRPSSAQTIGADSLAEMVSGASKAASAPGAEQTPPEAATGAWRIDLNAASASELERLPRVGPKTAARIVDYRMRYGPFPSVEALTAVRGIGPKTLERLRPHLVVN